MLLPNHLYYLGPGDEPWVDLMDNDEVTSRAILLNIGEGRSAEENLWRADLRGCLPDVDSESDPREWQFRIDRGDGAPQTWLLLPLDPPESELTTAYRAGQVVEFQARVLGVDDNPARAPHRRYILAEAAEGITLTLDYQGDPPLLVVDQTYRLVAWTDITRGSLSPAPTNATATVPAPLPDARSYGLQVFDDAGLLFLGLTNTDLRDDPLDVELTNAAGECPAVPVPSNPCVVSRQVQPLAIRWGDDRLTLYPGDDGQLTHDGALYEVSLYRNRQLAFPDPACTDYSELTRSLRIERVDPPPVLMPLNSTGVVPPAQWLVSAGLLKSGKAVPMLSPTVPL